MWWVGGRECGGWGHVLVGMRHAGDVLVADDRPGREGLTGGSDEKGSVHVSIGVATTG